MQIVIAHLFCKIMISILVCADVCVTDTLTSSPAKVNITLILSIGEWQLSCPVEILKSRM